MSAVRIIFCGCLSGVLLTQFCFAVQTKPDGKQDTKPNEQQEIKLDYLGDPLPPQAIFRFGTRRFQHPSNISQIILSKDDKLVFSLSTVKLIAWDAKSGKLMWQEDRPRVGGGLAAAGYGIRPMAIAPDTGELITGGGLRTINIYNPKTGAKKELQFGDGARTFFRSIDVSPDGKLIVAGSDKDLYMVDRAGQIKFQLKNQPKQPLGRIRNDRLAFGGHFCYARFSPDGKTLAFSKSENMNSVFLVNPQTGKTMREIKTKGRVVRFDFSPDSKTIVVSERDIAARLYNVKTGKQIWEFSITPINAAESYLSDIAFHPNGKQIAVGAPIGSDYRIRILDAADGKEKGALSGSQWKPWTMEYNSDGKTLYSAGWDSSVRRWNTTEFKQIPLEKGDRASACCTISRDGKRIAYGVDTGEVKIVDGTNRKLVRVLKHKEAKFSQIRFSDNAELLAAGGSSDDNVHLVVWNCSNGKIVHQWSWEKGIDPHSSIEELNFSHDGKFLAACVFRQHRVYVWDLESGKRIFDGRHAMVYGVSYKPDSSDIISVGWDRQIRQWDPTEKKEINTLEIPNNAGRNGPRIDARMYGVDHSPNGKILAVADMSRRIQIHDAQSLKLIRTIPMGGSFIYGTLRVSNNGLWVAAGFMNGQVVVYEIATGKPVWKFGKHVDHVFTVEFGANDNCLISGGSDGVCYLWSLRAKKFDAKFKSQMVDDLFGSDSEAAFQAFQAMSKQRTQVFGVIQAKLNSIFESNLKFEEPKFKKLTVAIGSSELKVSQQALEDLKKLGLESFGSVCELAATIADQEETPKKQAINDHRDQLLGRINRVLTFIADEPASVSKPVLTKLMRAAPSTYWKKLIFQKIQEQKRGQ